MKSCFFTLFPQVSNRGTTAEPYVPESTTINLRLKLVIFYRASPENIETLLKSFFCFVFLAFQDEKKKAR